MRPGKPELGVHGGDGVPSRDRGADRTWTLTPPPLLPSLAPLTIAACARAAGTRQWCCGMWRRGRSCANSGATLG